MVSVTYKAGLSYCWHQFDLEVHVIHMMRVVLVHRYIDQPAMDLY